MRRAIKWGAVTLMLLGVPWFLQGTGLLRGGNFTDQPMWAIFGFLAMAGGLSTLLYQRRTRQVQPETTLEYTPEPAAE
jgi:hypothetical protein